MWDPQQYHKFSKERARPFFDLLAQVQRERVGVAVDLGCGTGELTRALAERWPAARVIGVDNSREMLDQAEAHAIPGRLRFVQADLAAWRADEPIDLIVSNAALQWVGDHAGLLSRLADMLAPGGTLAVQVPSHFLSAAHRAVAETAADPRWRDKLAGVGLQPGAVQTVLWYAEWLHDHGFAVNAWETTYLHALAGEDAVLEWMKGTALRPLLKRLTAEEGEEYLRALSVRLRAAYPPRGGVTFFPFNRVFFIGTRGT
jgi:trans-aconitate 2-methyltransferase